MTLFSILEPDEPAGSARKNRRVRCGQGLREIRVHRAFLSHREFRVRRENRLVREHRPFRGYPIVLSVRVSRSFLECQVGRRVPFVRGSSGHLLHVDLARRFVHCRQLGQAVQVVLEVRSSRRLRGVQVLRAVRPVPWVPRVLVVQA